MNHFIPVLTGYFLRYISGSYVSLASAGFRKEPFLGNGKGMVAQISLSLPTTPLSVSLI